MKRPGLRSVSPRSGPVVDDVISKKIVFREGFGDDDLYLLLNYRDEGDWGFTAGARAAVSRAPGTAARHRLSP